MQNSDVLLSQNGLDTKPTVGEGFPTDFNLNGSLSVLSGPSSTDKAGVGGSPLSRTLDLDTEVNRRSLTSTTDDLIGLTRSSPFLGNRDLLTETDSVLSEDGSGKNGPGKDDSDQHFNSQKKGDPLTGLDGTDSDKTADSGSSWLKDTSVDSLLERGTDNNVDSLGDSLGSLQGQLTTATTLSNVSDSLLETYEKLIRTAKTSLINTYDGYVVDQVFSDKKSGFYAVGLVDPNNVNAPVLVIRGTEFGNPEDMLDDANPKGIGFGQFSVGKAAMEKWLKDITQDQVNNSKGYLPSITGESLGAAIAQSVAASYTSTGNQLSQVITFNSPGIDSDVIALFKTENIGKVLHLVAYGDIVSLAGESYLPGEYRLLDWDTEDSKVISIGQYILDKHNQEDDFLMGNSQIKTIAGLNTKDLSLSGFSYWTAKNVSKAARADWALLNLELGLLSTLIGIPPGTIPSMLSNRGTTELARGTLGGLIRELLEKRSDSPFADVLLKAGNAIDVVGDALVNNMKEWNDETWAAVAEWDEDIWSAIAASGVPAVSYLAVGGAEAAEALASGGVLAATALAAGSIEAFEALTKGGATALKALSEGDGKLAWEAIIKGGDGAWKALNGRGLEGWEALANGGDKAWSALKNSGSAAWASLQDGSKLPWDLIQSGIASKLFDIGSKKILEKFDSVGNLFEKVEFLSDGQQVISKFSKGILDIRNYFNSDGKLFKQVDFQSGGKQVIDHFTNGVNTLRNFFGSDGKLFKKVSFQSGGQQVIDHFTNGVNTLRNFFGSDGKLFKKVSFQSGGQQVIDHFTNGVNTLRNFFGGDGKLFKKVSFQSGGKQVIDHFTNGVNTLRNFFGSDGKLFKKVSFQSGGKQVIDHFSNGVNTLRELFGSDGNLFKKVTFQSAGKQVVDYFSNGVNTLRELFGSDGKLFEKVTFQSGGKQVIDYFTNGVNTLRNYFGSDGKLFEKVTFQSGGKQVIDYFTNGANTLRNYFGSDGKLFKKVKFLPNSEQAQHFYRNGREYLRKVWNSSAGAFAEYAWDSAGTYLGGKTYNAAGKLLKATGKFFEGATQTLSDIFKPLEVRW